MATESWLDGCVVRYTGAGMKSAKCGGRYATLGCIPLPEIRWKEEGDGGAPWKTGGSGVRGEIWGVGNKLITHFIKRKSDEKRSALR